MARYELSDGKSNKFWEIERDGASITVRWGRIGTPGQSKTKTFASAEAAQQEVDKLTREKLAKGYALVGEAPASAAAPSAPSPASAPTSSSPASGSSPPRAVETAGAATGPAAFELLVQQLAALGASRTDDSVEIVGPDVSPELAAWARAVGGDGIEIASGAEADRYTPASGGGRLLPVRGVSLTEAIARRDANWVARFRGLFAGLSLVVEDDEGGLVASWVPLPSQTSQTYIVHQNEWRPRKAAPSIGGALRDLLSDPLPELADSYRALDKVTGKEKFPPALDPVALWKATDWLVELFLEVGVGEPAKALAAALPFKQWNDAKELLARWPQLANYWLVAHYALGNKPELDETLQLTSAHVHPATVEIRQLVTDGKLPVRYPPEALQAMAPAKLLGADAKKRLKAREKELMVEPPEVVEARAALQADESAAAARQLFDELASLHKQPENQRFRRRLRAIRELASAVDARWLPILLYHQRIAATVIDDHELAIPGLVLAIAKLSPDFTSFRQRIDHYGTSTFGRERRQEYAIAVGEFIDDPQARAWLVERARAWAERIDAWDVPVSPEYADVLLQHALPDTFALIERVLSAKAFHGGNWQICLETAIAAGRLGAASTLPAVRSAFERGLGAHDPKERQKMLASIEALERAAAG